MYSIYTQWFVPQTSLSFTVHNKNRTRSCSVRRQSNNKHSMWLHVPCLRSRSHVFSLVYLLLPSRHQFELTIDSSISYHSNSEYKLTKCWKIKLEATAWSMFWKIEFILERKSCILKSYLSNCPYLFSLFGWHYKLTCQSTGFPS